MPRPRAAGRRSGRGEDAAGARAGRRAAAGVQAGAVHPRPDARRRHRLAGLRRAHRRVRVPAPARCSPICCWPTRSTAPRRRRRPRCSRRWRSARSASTARPRPLPDPFIVAATQNPIEYEGTYQLPEAQLDRFLLKLNVPLPPRDPEIAILGRHAHGFDPRDLSAIQPGGRARPSWPPAATRCGRCWSPTRCSATSSTSSARPAQSPSLQLGVSPRGATALLATARSWAWLSGRNYVTPDDVKAMARPTLRHRVMLRPEAELEGRHPRRRARRHPGRRFRCRASGPHRPHRAGRADLRPADRGVALARNGFRRCCWRRWRSRWPSTSALAASPRRLRYTRSADTSARLGEQVDAVLLIHNDGRRRFRGQVRDAWPPSAGARTPHPSPWTSPPGSVSASQTQLRPVRRGDQRSAVVTARSIGPLGLAGRQRSQPGARTGARAAAVPVPQASAVAAGQAARDRRAAAGADPRAGHRIRFAA